DEYRTLKSLNDDIATRRELAQLEKDELEFRNTVGELADGDLAKKLTTPQAALDQCAADQRAIDAIKARFVEAFGSLDDLENSMEPPTCASESLPTTHVKMPIAIVEKFTGIRPALAAYPYPSEVPPGTPTAVISSKTIHDLVAPTAARATSAACSSYSGCRGRPRPWPRPTADPAPRRASADGTPVSAPRGNRDIAMVFAKPLREGVRRGRIRCSVRIWQHLHVKVG